MDLLELPKRSGVVEDYRGSNPRVILIGEAPGRREAELGQPFIGPSEERLRMFWRGTGLVRNDFYITNVLNVRPKGNEIGSVSRQELIRAAEELRGRVDGIPGAIVVPTGSTALWALFDREMPITDWRGSILEWRGRKVIPTIHPAATMRQPVLCEFCVADWRRVGEELNNPQPLPSYRHIIDPTEDEIEQWKNGLISAYARYQLESKASDPPFTLAIDVENLVERPRHVTCVGFSYEPAVSLTIPLEEPLATAPHQYRYEAIAEICGGPWEKVLQNGLTDAVKLAANAIEVRNYNWDLIEMAHCLNPNDGSAEAQTGEDELALGGPQIRISTKSLAVLTSLYTRIPYYKWMGGDKNWEVRQKYNGLDCCATQEIFPKLWGKLKAKGML